MFRFVQLATPGEKFSSIRVFALTLYVIAPHNNFVVLDAKKQTVLEFGREWSVHKLGGGDWEKTYILHLYRAWLYALFYNSKNMA